MPAQGPTIAETTMAAENAAKIMTGLMPRSAAIGVASTAGR